MSTRVHQPLVFSIDTRLLEQQLMRLDLCSKNLTTIDQLPISATPWNVILFDHNEISKLEHLDHCSQLIQLSISRNHLIDIQLLHRLRSIQKLNLSYNLIDSIECLQTLQNLVVLNISNNNIRSVAVLNHCHALHSVDASGNAIQQIEDLTHLISLKYLNLHQNFLERLNSLSHYWPRSIHTLVISDNQIEDLTEVSYLSSLINLNTLYIVGNPCLPVIEERHGCHRLFDYRPYILNWCLSIHNLDGIFITRKESLKAEWLLSQGNGRSFGSGEHPELVQYLTRVCGTDVNQKDDLNLSRSIFQQDFYNQQRPSEYTNGQMMSRSEAIKDANETFSLNIQQSALIPKLEFNELDISSSVSTDHETLGSSRQYHMRTPSPRSTRSTTSGIIHLDDQITENSSTNRYNDYDDRPAKPLDQKMLQTKLSKYPVDNCLNDPTNRSRSQTDSDSQQLRSTPFALVYNADRYSPKTTACARTLSGETNQTLEYRNRMKHPKRNLTNTNACQCLSHPHDSINHHLKTTTASETKKQQPLIDTSDDNRNRHIDDELQLKSASVHAMLSTENTTMNNTADLEKLTTSVETMRTSILQAYMDLHEKFTKTTELQTSALTALWKKCETQSLTHRRETDKIIQANQLLTERIHELEVRLQTNQSHLHIPSSDPTVKPNPNIHPPLRAHISKRDARSFFLHWIPNPLNEQHTILGYRIYMDDKLKGAIDSGRFEAIIDYIRDEGEYKIKIRTYNQQGESADSNIVIARFRRQHSAILNSESAMIVHRTPSDQSREDDYQKKLHENSTISTDKQITTPIIMNKQRQDNLPITPDKQITTSNETALSTKLTPHSTTTNQTVTRKPPISPTSSPSRTDKRSPTNELSVLTAKRSPARSGIMTRLTKSSHKLKQNHSLLNILPIEQSNSPTQSINVANAHVRTAKRAISFQADLISSDHGDLSAPQVPCRSSLDVQNAVDNHHLVTRSYSFSSNSPSPPPFPR